MQIGTLLPGLRTNARGAHKGTRVLQQNQGEFAPEYESHKICVEPESHFPRSLVLSWLGTIQTLKFAEASGIFHCRIFTK
jgi:hypothetical protein